MNESIKIFLLLLILLSLNCRQAQVTTGTTFFKTYGILQIPTNGLLKTEPQTINGVYLPFFQLSRSPALLFLDQGKTLAYVVLNDTLEVRAGDFVLVIGAANDGAPSAASFTSERVQVIHASHDLLERAAQDYGAMKEKLVKTAPSSSKLRLPERPDWLMVVDEPRGCAVAFFTAADLMFAAEINLVYDLSTGRLTAAYVDHFFKGE